MLPPLDCQYRHGRNCRIAAQIAGLEIIEHASDAACAACKRSAPPQTKNKVTYDLAIGCLRRLGRDDDAWALLRSSPDIYPPVQSGAERLQRIEAANGVGSHVWRLLASLGVKHTPTCSCLALAEEMNALGPDGCRSERERLVSKMRANAKQYGWGTVATAAARAVTTGLVWRLDLTDLYGSILDEGIRLAETAVRINPG